VPDTARRVRQTLSSSDGPRSFQAIKPQVRRHVARVESSNSAAYYAGWAAARTPTSCRSWPAWPSPTCSEAYFHAAAENIQIHGGSASPGSIPPIVTQAAKFVRAALRRPGLSPGELLAAHRHLNRRRRNRLAEPHGARRAILGLWLGQGDAPAIGRTRERRPRTVIGSPTWFQYHYAHGRPRLRTSMIGSIGSGRAHPRRAVQDRAAICHFLPPRPRPPRRRFRRR